METRICKKCGENKSLDSISYHRDKNYPNGFKTTCKVCKNLMDRERYEVKKNNFIPNVTCNICQKTFYKKPSDILDVNFCGSKCFHDYKKTIKYPERKTGVHKNCGHCGKEIYRIKTQAKENNFCSMSCLYEFQKGKPNIKLNNGKIVQCNGCEKQIYRSKGELEGNNFCTKECHDNFRKKRVIKKCNNCNLDFEVRTSRIIFDKIFCSKPCESQFKKNTLGVNDSFDQNGIKLRKCNQCESIKPLNTNFYIKEKNCKNGFRAECKSCLNEKIMQKYRTNEFFKMKMRLRSIISNSFKKKNFKRNKHTHKILGCSINHFIKYMEDKFEIGMNWENHGKWHIDHIIPLASAKNIEELYKLNHFTNLQPLWAEDNLKKSDKISEQWGNA